MGGDNVHEGTNMSFAKILRLFLVALAILYTVQSGIFLYLFSRDYRRGENGVTKGFMALTAGLFVGGSSTTADRVARLINGNYLPTWLVICRIISHILCISGLYMIYETILGEYNDNEIPDSAYSE